MASMPKCLQNPGLRLVKVGDGFVTVERVKSLYKNQPAYDVFYEGQKIGNTFKLRSKWYAGSCYSNSRQVCIEHLLTNHLARVEGAP